MAPSEPTEASHDPDPPGRAGRTRAREPLDPLAPSARRFAAGASLLVLLAAAVGASVRLLPWVLDPRISRATLRPFAESLSVIAVEVALLTGWPVGWALAAQRLVERGEARALASLGEPPERTLARLAPQALVLALALAITSVALGRTSAAPGRVVDALLAEGRAACEVAAAPTTHAVPFVSATWLCGAEGTPRLVGRAPLGGVVFTARDARVSDDLRRIDLDDARLRFASASGGGLALRVHVESLSLRGLAPFTVASPLPPWLRAVLVVASAAGTAGAAVLGLLRLRRRVGFVAAVVVGAAGPLAGLALLRALELRLPEHGRLGVGWLAALALVPAIATGCVVLAIAIANGLAAVLRRLALERASAALRARP